MNLFSEELNTATASEPEAAASPLDMLRCGGCGREMVADVVLAGDAACPYCGSLFRQPAYRRIEAIVDSGSFIEIEREAEGRDPLSFPGYKTKIEKERMKSKIRRASSLARRPSRACARRSP